MLKFGKKGIITFLVAALAMVFASGAMAAEFGDIKSKLEAGTNVKMDGNVTATETISITKPVTLDLNGFKIEIAEDKKDTVSIFSVGADGKLTITDTSAKGNGVIESKATGRDKAYAIYIENGGAAILEKGIIQTTAFGDPVRIMGALKSETPVYSSFTMNGGKVIGGQWVIRPYGNGATVTINGGEITSNGKYNDYSTIQGLGTAGYGGTIININGGTLTGGTDGGLGIYHPQDGVLNISGGTITGYDGVQLKAGKLVMTGGVIKATGAKPEEYPDSGNGSVVTACAISLISNKSYTGDINVNISGKAELESTKACAVFSKITVGDNKVNKIEISGGSFRGGDQALLLEDAANIDVSLTGGSYSSDPSDYVDKTIYTIVGKDGLFTVKEKAAPVVTPVEPKLPDETSEEVKAEIKPATAVVLEVDTTTDPITEATKAAAIDKAMAVISADITSKDLTVNEETGAVEIAVATASEAAKGLLKDNETLASKDIAPLPVFTAEVDEGKTAMVSYQLTGSALKAETAEEVRVMKILSSTTAGEFEYASEITADMDGKFTIQKADGKTIYSGALEAGTKYLLTLFIKDGSSFDLDGAEDGSITDPAAIFSTTTTEPQHGSSSSGCNGGFGALALLGLALVPMFYGKKR